MKGVLTENSVHHFLICVFYVAHITAETVLVKLFVGVCVPETAGVGGDLVGQDDGAVGKAAELQLEVDQADLALQEVAFRTSLTRKDRALMRSISSRVASLRARAWYSFSRGSCRSSFL